MSNIDFILYPKKKKNYSSYFAPKPLHLKLVTYLKFEAGISTEVFIYSYLHFSVICLRFELSLE